MNRCVRLSEGGCTPTTGKAKGKGVALYFPDGVPGPVCHDHLPRPLWQENCSHSLAPSGRCAYCGKHVPDATA